MYAHSQECKGSGIIHFKCSQCQAVFLTRTGLETHQVRIFSEFYLHIGILKDSPWVKFKVLLINAQGTVVIHYTETYEYYKDILFHTFIYSLLPGHVTQQEQGGNDETAYTTS